MVICNTLGKWSDSHSHISALVSRKEICYLFRPEYFANERSTNDGRDLVAYSPMRKCHEKCTLHDNTHVCFKNAFALLGRPQIVLCVMETTATAHSR